jgi:hypothetical protein
MADTAKTLEKTLELLQALQDLTDKLTWHRVLIAIVTGISTLLLYTCYEYHSAIVQSIVGYAQKRNDRQFTDWTVSAPSAQQLRALSERNPLVHLVMVEKIDLQHNRRIPKFWSIGSTSEQDKFTNIVNAQLPGVAFDDDAQNVQQLIGILNNEFVCTPYEKSPLWHITSELKKSAPYVCSIAVPPFYGRMLGVLTLGLRAEPSKTEYAAIRSEAMRLAVELYLYDITKQGK